MESNRLCPKCKEPSIRRGYCKKCHASYMRANRKKYEQLNPTQKSKSVARSIAKVYQKRGKIHPESCFVCNSDDNVEKHHSDYSKPLDVIFLCRKHHRLVHQVIPFRDKLVTVIQKFVP